MRRIDPRVAAVLLVLPVPGSAQPNATARFIDQYARSHDFSGSIHIGQHVARHARSARN
jgi:hypothetical protein